MSVVTINTTDRPPPVRPPATAVRASKVFGSERERAEGVVAEVVVTLPHVGPYAHTHTRTIFMYTVSVTVVVVVDGSIALVVCVFASGSRLRPFLIIFYFPFRSPPPTARPPVRPLRGVRVFVIHARDPRPTHQPTPPPPALHLRRRALAPSHPVRIYAYITCSTSLLVCPCDFDARLGENADVTGNSSTRVTVIKTRKSEVRNNNSNNNKCTFSSLPCKSAVPFLYAARVRCIIYAHAPVRTYVCDIIIIRRVRVTTTTGPLKNERANTAAVPPSETD